MKKTQKHDKAQALAIAAVVKLIGVVMFIIVGILVMEPMMHVGEKVSAEKCRQLFDMRAGMADSMGNMYGSLLDVVPDIGKTAANFGGGYASAMALDYGCDWCVSGEDPAWNWKANRKIDDASELAMKQALFQSLPDICGTIKTKCVGSVYEVSKCLHDKIRWTYYALAGVKGPEYSRKMDLFEVEVQVTEPSTVEIYMIRGGCDSLSDMYSHSFDNTVVEDLPGSKGSWCRINMEAVNLDTIAISGMFNCMDQKDGPADLKCKCFYHPELGYSMDQGFHIPMVGSPYFFEGGEIDNLLNSYPQYPGYGECGRYQPEEEPDWYAWSYVEWWPDCNWKRLSALSGYENKTCTLRIGVDVIGETYKVKTEDSSHSCGFLGLSTCYEVSYTEYTTAAAYGTRVKVR